MKVAITVPLFFTLALPSIPQSYCSKKPENIVYGMVSGTALLMDVYDGLKSI